MAPQERSASVAREQAASGAARIWRSFLAASLPAKILQVAVALAVLLVAAVIVHTTIVFAFVYLPLLLGYGIFCIWTSKRTVLASVTVAAAGLGIIVAAAHGREPREPWYALFLLLPVVVAVAAHLGQLGRWHVPCRTIAWSLGWALPFGIAALQLPASDPFIAPVTAWLIALVVLGWRLAKAMQDSRGAAYAGALAAPYAAGPYAAGPAGAGAGRGQRTCRLIAGVPREAQPRRAARPPARRAARDRRAAAPDPAPSGQPRPRTLAGCAVVIAVSSAAPRPQPRTGRTSPSTRRWPS